VGERVVSVFSGAADKDAYDQVPLVSRQRTIKVTHDDTARKLHALYQQIRDIRDHQRPYDELPGLWADLKSNHPHDWLASMEILEILFKKSLYPELRLEIKQSLDAKTSARPELTKLITDGLSLIV
jgi:phenylalanine-4-hydroxylase